MTSMVFAKPHKQRRIICEQFLIYFEESSQPTLTDYPDIEGCVGVTGTSSILDWLNFLLCESFEPEHHYIFALREGTSHSPTSMDFDEMFILEIAAERQDERAFIATANDIDWSTRSAEDYATAVHLALASGAHMKARQLAIGGSEKYPEHEEITKMAKVLAPPLILSTNIPSKPGAGANLVWLKEQGDQYRGQWVALKDGDLLANANNFAEIINIVGNPRGKGILVTKVY